jgi:hypothetical protein
VKNSGSRRTLSGSEFLGIFIQRIRPTCLSHITTGSGPYDHWSTTFSRFRPQVLQNTTVIAENQQRVRRIFRLAPDAIPF